MSKSELYEAVQYLRKIAEVLKAGVTVRDHTFKPEVEVTDAGVVVPVEGFIYSLKAEGSDIKYNIDREVTATEYDVVWKNTIVIISRLGSKIYAKTPAGHVGKLWIKALKLGG